MKVLNILRFEIKAIRTWLEFKRKKHLADLQHKITGKQYYIVATTGGHCTIIDNEKKKVYNRIAKKVGARQIDHFELLKNAWYRTPQCTLIRTK